MLLKRLFRLFSNDLAIDLGKYAGLCARSRDHPERAVGRRYSDWVAIAR